MAVLMAVLALTLPLCMGAQAFTTAPPKSVHFRADGTFKVLHICDTQDNQYPRPAMILFLDRLIEQEDPDFIIFGGDQTYDTAHWSFSTKKALDWQIAPLLKHDVPFDAVLGNHDSPSLFSVFRDITWGNYNDYTNSLTDDPAWWLHGSGTHNTPVYSADGSQVLYNFWLIDGGDYDYFATIWSNIFGGNSSVYDYVHDDQIEWIKTRDRYLTDQNEGVPVPSMAVQHMIAPDIYEYLVEAPADAEDDYRWFDGKKYLAQFKDDAVYTGLLQETPCPPDHPNGEVAALSEIGVKAILTGHDHVNNFITNIKGVDFLQTGSVGYNAYGNDNVRGCRVIELNTADLSTYTTRTVLYSDILTDPADIAMWQYGKTEEAEAITEEAYKATKGVKTDRLNAMLDKMYELLAAAAGV
jgi:hypothetical protein